MSRQQPDRPAANSPVAADLEAALRSPEVLLRAVLSTAGDYIAIVDRDHRIRFLNRADSGFTMDQVLGRDILEFAIEDTGEPLREAIDAAFATASGRSLQTRVRTPDGLLRDFLVRVGPVIQGGAVAAAIVCSEDVSSVASSARDLQRERAILRRLIDIQERERQLVSYDIHDGLAQYLTGAMLHLQACERAIGATPERRDLTEGLRLLRAAADEARRLIGGLRPPALDELGITEALESLVTEARNDIRRIEFIHDLPPPRLRPEVETTIFRIVQESLSNVRRHAKADTVTIRLDANEHDDIRLVVHDDGAGFDTTAVAEDRFGLEGIRQRASVLGGTASIRSRPGAGTTIHVTIPRGPQMAATAAP